MRCLSLVSIVISKVSAFAKVYNCFVALQVAGLAATAHAPTSSRHISEIVCKQNHKGREGEGGRSSRPIPLLPSIPSRPDASRATCVRGALPHPTMLQSCVDSPKTMMRFADRSWLNECGVGGWQGRTHYCISTSASRILTPIKLVTLITEAP